MTHMHMARTKLAALGSWHQPGTRVYEPADRRRAVAHGAGNASAESDAAGTAAEKAECI